MFDLPAVTAINRDRHWQQLAAMAWTEFQRFEHGKKTAHGILKNRESEMGHAVARAIGSDADCMGRPRVRQLQRPNKKANARSEPGSKDRQGAVGRGSRRGLRAR